MQKQEVKMKSRQIEGREDQKQRKRGDNKKRRDVEEGVEKNNWREKKRGRKI